MLKTMLLVAGAAPFSAELVPKFSYAPVNVWPLPSSMQLCGGGGGDSGDGGDSAPCAGPHAVPSTLNISISIGAGCAAAPDDDDLLGALAREAVQLATSFKPSPRTYDEAPYAAADAWCPKACSADADCGTGSACVVPSQRRWSSKDSCSPSSKFSRGCGCCNAGSALPTIKKLSIVCKGGEAEKEAAAVGGYKLMVDAADGIAITSASTKGAANALSTLAQLLRYDTDSNQHVMDFVPLAIVDAPKLRWRGQMLDTSRHFIPVEEILQLIDGLWAAKMNVRNLPCASLLLFLFLFMLSF